MRTISRDGLCYFFSLLISSCGTTRYMDTAKDVNLNSFMGSWYVLAGRFTFLEKDVYNAVESYTWNKDDHHIDVSFTYNQGSFDGKVKSVPQKAWVEDHTTNAYWKVSPLWPLKFDYLILDVAEDYSWTAVGTPNQKYLWIMARDPKNAKAIIDKVINRLNKKGYDTAIETTVPHR
jgi:apolipoprotein D and lipocalin family protein